MAESSTVEIEKKEEKPLENPLKDTDSIEGTTHDKKVSEWIDYQNRNNKSDTQGK